MSGEPQPTLPQTVLAVLVISSHVVRGSVGNRAVAFALEALGHPTWILPTITLPWHPGHGAATRITAPAPAFDDICNDLATAPWHGEIAGVVSGYMANAQQVESVGKLVRQLKKSNPKLTYLCDPVIGDTLGNEGNAAYGQQGRLYVADETAQAIVKILMPLADISTPNMFELGWMAEQSPEQTPEQSPEQFMSQNQAQLLAQARGLRQQMAIDNLLVTSVPGLMRGTIGSILINQHQALMSEHKALSEPPNGLGDLTSALFLSHYLNGLPLEKILEKTTASAFEILARTAREGADELALERNIISLSRPMAMVNMRQLK